MVFQFIRTLFIGNQGAYAYKWQYNLCRNFKKGNKMQKGSKKNLMLRRTVCGVIFVFGMGNVSI